MSDPILDPSIFDTIWRDAYRAQRLKFWTIQAGIVVLAASFLVIVLGAAVGVAKWLAGI